MDQEPSVLDFLKARIRDWRNTILHSSENNEEKEESKFWIEETETPVPVQVRVNETFAKAPFRFPWRALLAFSFGLWGQLALEPHPGVERTWQTGVFFYTLAGLVLIWANFRNEFSLPAWGEIVHEFSQDTRLLRSSIAFIVSLAFALIAFVAFAGNQFTKFNVVVWIIAILTMIYAFWRPKPNQVSWFSRARNFISRSKWNISLDRSIILVLAIALLVIFFRLYQLSEVPSQMISDQAEKLWDIGDVLNGKTSIFFVRNTGREFFQFYLTAAIILLFKTGLTYLSLKIGTVSAGLVTVYYIYLIGKEIGGTRVGLLAMAFSGIAYWPNVISRFGLRFPLYPLFYAPAIYYLIRGLQRRNRNDFILSGLCVGLGLHGYSPFRVVPFVILLAVGLYLVHRQSNGFRRQAIWGLFALGIIALIVFLPLLRYMIENPGMVFYRAMTRVGDLERPLPGSAFQIFLQNLWHSLTMFAWDDGEVWPISVPHRPVLDVVTSALFHFGVALLIIRYIRQRHWFDIFTLLSIPALMMPSILSLAFPGENPALNRSAGAIVPVFLIVGMALDSLLRALESASISIWNKRFAWALGIFLLVWASLQNYDLVFNQYKTLYDLSAWNTTEMGEIVHSFYNLTGSADTIWLVGYPYWVDSRLVMINGGFPMRDNAIWPENFQSTVDDPRPKLFMINLNDLPAIESLKSLYPTGQLTEYKSKYKDKDFMLFFVPAR